MISKRWYVVAILSILYVVSGIDRLAIALLIEPIKADLHVDDTQIALLVGAGFALLYAALGVPIAWLADRGNRTLIGAGGAMIWSAMTIASAFAESFPEMMVLRMGVAVGEAALTPVAISLIGDYFPVAERSTPSALYISSGVVGMMLAYLVGAAMLDFVAHGGLAGIPIVGALPGWRATMALLGVPGLLLGILLAITTREPVRGRLEARPPRAAPEGFGIFGSANQAWTFYAWFFAAAASITTLTFAALSWYPSYLVRSFGASASASGYLFSPALAFAALMNLGIAILAQRAVARGRADLLILILLITVPAGVISFCLSLAQSDIAMATVLCVLGFGLLSGSAGQASVAVNLTAPAHLRGRLTAINLAANSIVGMALGTFVVGYLSQHAFSGNSALGSALGVTALIVAPVACLCLALSWHPFRNATRAATG